MVPNESIRYHGVDDCVEEESESDSREPIGLPGKRPVSQPADEFAVLDVVKTFFDAFWIVRENTTPNTVQMRRPLEGFLSSSVFDLFSSVFVSLRVERRRSTDTYVAASKASFGRLMNIGDCLPVGAQVLEQQYCGIVNDDGVMGDKRQRKVLTGGRFVFTECSRPSC